MLMQVSCDCCNPVRLVTIKGIDKTDGTTVWEYGPGSLWRHHYGADEISGFVPNLSATLNKHATVAGQFPAYNNCANRNTATLVANCCEAFSVVKLDSTDGTTIDESVLTGLFCNAPSGTSVSLLTGFTATNAAALSGGQYMLVGDRPPSIEFLDFTSNAATKEYILHAHTQQTGSVYFKTRTSNETITVDYDATAAEIEAAFEATADCVSATATGGPWPHVAVEIEVEWSAAGGDVSAISATYTSDIGGTGASGFENLTELPMVFGWEWALTIDNINVGTEVLIYFDGTGGLPLGDQFSYTSTTDDPATFVSLMNTAFTAFLSANALDDDWSEVFGHTSSGTTFTVNYYTPARHLQFEIIDDPPIIGNRRAGGCAATYNTSTGLLTGSIGYIFGMDEFAFPSNLFSETASVPTVLQPAQLGIQCCGSGPDNKVSLTPLARNNGDATRASTIEIWQITAGVWSIGTRRYINATRAVPEIIQAESGKVCIPIYAKNFDGARERTVAAIDFTTYAVTESMTTFGSITAPNNNVATQMLADDAANFVSSRYNIPNPAGAWFNRINAFGDDTWYDGTQFRLGGDVFAADATSIYAFSREPVRDFVTRPIGDTIDSEVYFRFYATAATRSTEPQQFRFVLDRMPGTNYTAWIDWFATESEIETALNTLLGAGNCSLVDYGGFALQLDNNPVSLIEANPMFEFKTDRGFGSGSGFIPVSYFGFSGGVLRDGVRIEVQTVTAFTSPIGIAAYDATDASRIWSRPFGTALNVAFTVQHPQYAWLRGDLVYAYGQLLENEL